MAIGSLLAGATGGASISIIINAVDKFSGTFAKVNKGMLLLGGAITAIGVAGAGAVIGLTKMAGQFEQTTIAFTTMLGSAEEADKLLQELADFATKTPFTIVGVEQNAKQLIAMGIEIDNLLPTLKSLGDVSAGLSVPLERIAINFGQVKVQGKLTGRELRDFSIAGVPLIAELAKNLNKAESEIKEMVSAGKIGFKEVEDAFTSMTSDGGKFFNLMDKQSKSFLGQMSNVQDSLIKIGRIMGEVFLPVAKLMAEQLGIIVGWMEKHPTLVKFAAAALGIATALALIIGPTMILLALSPLIIEALTATSIAGGPVWATAILIGIAFLAVIVTIVAVIAIFNNLKNSWNEFVIGTKNMWREWTVNFIRNMASLRKQWISLWGGAANFFIEIWNKIVDFGASKVNEIIDSLNILIGAFNRFAGKLGFSEIERLDKVTFSNFKGELVDVYGKLRQVSEETRNTIKQVNDDFLESIQPQLDAIEEKRAAEETVTEELEKQLDLTRKIPENIGTAVTTLKDVAASEKLLRSSGKEITSAGTIFDPTNFNSSQFQSLEDLMEAEKLTGTTNITNISMDGAIIQGVDVKDLANGLLDELTNKIIP